MFRSLLLIHRYLGIALGLVVVLWCLSGFVMLYVQYPDFTAEERLPGLAPLDLRGCCVFPGADEFTGIDIDRFRIEMVAGMPVIRLRALSGAEYSVVLRDGEYLEWFDEHAARRAVAAFQPAGSELHYLGLLERDQWTVTAAYDGYRPFHFFAGGENGGSRWYVASSTGEVVQHTTTSVRFWNWIGSVVHWLYPTILRADTDLWAQVVIWLSLPACFLTLIGIYLGIKQYRLRANGRHSPYHGMGLWHHYTGLFFGLVILTWLVSGFFSVNPWGLFESEGAAREHARIRGTELSLEHVRGLVPSLAQQHLPEHSVRLDGYMHGGELFLLAYRADGSFERLAAANFEPAAIPPERWQELPAHILPAVPVAQAGWLTQGDSYYYSHHDSKRFPVYRVIYANAERTRYYLDARTGELLLKVDSNSRWHRWLFLALHRFDFAGLPLWRPAWDLLMWLLLLGATLGGATGTYLGIRRLLR